MTSSFPETHGDDDTNDGIHYPPRAYAVLAEILMSQLRFLHPDAPVPKARALRLILYLPVH